MQCDSRSIEKRSGSGGSVPFTAYDEKQNDSTGLVAIGGDAIAPNERKTSLHRGLKGRHLSMIAMGGAIGVF
jgi:amino acid permease